MQIRWDRLSKFLPCTPKATAVAKFLAYFIVRYNLERCKICDEKAVLEICAHCDRRACNDCRATHLEMMKRDLTRMLNQVKRLSSRITEASDGLSKGAGLLALNCETAKDEVKEYFRRYYRELKKREEAFIDEIETFQATETRLMRNLRDILEIESSNMSEGCAYLEAALKGEREVKDTELVKFKNIFSDGLEYLRNFQPDADELFSKKLRFTPGDDASKLTNAIANFGELTVLLPQFAGRYLPLEQSYLPRPIRIGYESDNCKYAFRRAELGETSRLTAVTAAATGRHLMRSSLATNNNNNNSNNNNNDEDMMSIRYRRRQQMEEEAWNRLRADNLDVPGRQSPNGVANGAQTPGNSPWSRTMLSSGVGTPLESKVETTSKNLNAVAAKVAQCLQSSDPDTRSQAAVIGDRSTTRATVDHRQALIDNSSTAAVDLASNHRSQNPERYSQIPVVARMSRKPPLPPQQAAGAVSDEALLNERFETLRLMHQRRQMGKNKKCEDSTDKTLSHAKTGDEETAATQSSDESEFENEPVQVANRFRIITKNASDTHKAIKHQNSDPTLLTSTQIDNFTSAATATAANEIQPLPIPVTHYPSSTDLPPWIARRRQRYQRSKTNPDLAEALASNVTNSGGSSISGNSNNHASTASSRRVQQLLLERSGRMEKLTGLVGQEDETTDLTSSSGKATATLRTTTPEIRSRLRSRSILIPERRDRSEDRKRDSTAGKSGTIVRMIGTGSSSSSSSVIDYFSKSKPRLVFGKKGSREGELNWPRGIAVISAVEFAVCDSSNHRVCVFNRSSGRLVRMFGKYGAGDTQLDSAAALCCTKGRQMIVSDRYNHRIVIFDSNGKFVRKFGGHGPSNGRFNNPWGVAIDDMGIIYVADKDNHRVQMFDSKGQFMGKFGSMGSAPGQFNNPQFIAIHRRTQNVYVSDSCNHRVQVLDHNGNPIFQFGGEGYDNGQLKFPRGIAVDEQGFITVADSGNNRIQIFCPDGRFMHSFGSWGTGLGQLKGVEDVAIQESTIIVSDRENHRIQLF